MKIATFNINNVNRRLPNLLDWLAPSPLAKTGVSNADARRGGDTACGRRPNLSLSRMKA